MGRQAIFVGTLLVVAMAAHGAEEPALTDELRERVADWRSKHLPAREPERYWQDLRELGAKVGEAGARGIEEAGAVDIDSAVALMAYYAFKEPGKIEELGGLHGVHRDQVAREWFAEHKTPEYRHAWEAWLLFPVEAAQGSEQPRRLMRTRLSTALMASGDSRTVALLVELCRVLPEQPLPLWGLAQSEQLFDEIIQSKSMDIHRIVHEIGGEAAVRAMVELLRIAEEQGYAGEGEDGLRQQFIYRLSSTLNPRVLRENPRLLESLRVPGVAVGAPGSLRPADNKWREYKPIVEGLLSEEVGLSEEALDFLREALAAMPEG